ncbi:hypothetical protein [Microcoleus sp. D2_18a_B4]|uniref:hypothetical protein n=1 Tax=Microcoleus sp. D2_18a_B4 TaxID=3055329 RepID=UPI002FCF3E0A
MPVPQKKLSFVERASCPFLRMVQDVSYHAKLIVFRMPDLLSFDYKSDSGKNRILLKILTGKD